MNEPILYDLHSHTCASDGLLTPEELVQRAAGQGVTVLAITDHDTIAGIVPAQEAIVSHQLRLSLISGVEISTCWKQHEIHVVGLGIDREQAALIGFLACQIERRIHRATRIGERLAQVRIPGALEKAQQLAQGGAITRAHFARFLVEDGRAADISRAFKTYLVRGKAGYVPPEWPTMAEAITMIQQAGGVAVLAHPGRYQLSTKWLKQLIEDFRLAGGQAMEIAHCQQPAGERLQLARYALVAGLAVSQGSDFHYPSRWIELGKGLTLPENVQPVWQRYPMIHTDAFTA